MRTTHVMQELLQIALALLLFVWYFGSIAIWLWAAALLSDSHPWLAAVLALSALSWCAVAVVKVVQGHGR